MIDTDLNLIRILKQLTKFILIISVLKQQFVPFVFRDDHVSNYANASNYLIKQVVLVYI